MLSLFGSNYNFLSLSLIHFLFPYSELLLIFPKNGNPCSPIDVKLTTANNNNVAALLLYSKRGLSKYLILKNSVIVCHVLVQFRPSFLLPSDRAGGDGRGGSRHRGRDWLGCLPLFEADGEVERVSRWAWEWGRRSHFNLDRSPRCARVDWGARLLERGGSRDLPAGTLCSVTYSNYGDSSAHRALSAYASGKFLNWNCLSLTMYFSKSYLIFHSPHKFRNNLHWRHTNTNTYIHIHTM